MSTTHELTWGRLHVDKSAGEPIARVYVYTASEQARIATLRRVELVELLADAAAALREIDQQQRRELRSSAMLAEQGSQIRREIIATLNR